MSRLSILCAAALGVACASPTQPGAAVEVRPSGTSFARAANGGASVPYTVANAGPASVLLTSRCGDHLSPVVEQRTSAGWVPYAGGACLTVYPMSPVPLAAGATRDDVVSVGAAGEYRLVLGTDRGEVASAAFTVR